MAEVLTAFIAFVPRIFGAAALLVLGVLLAVVARWLVPLLLRRLRFDDLCQRTGVTSLLEQGGITRRPSQLLGLVIAYALVGYALLTALGAVGLTFLAGSLNELILYAPRALTAVFLVILGVAAAGLLAEVTGRLLTDVGIGGADTLRGVVRSGVIFVVAILAAALLGIDVALLIAITAIALSGLALTAALAVGLGLRGLSQNIVASRYIAEGIAEGDRITINGNQRDRRVGRPRADHPPRRRRARLPRPQPPFPRTRRREGRSTRVSRGGRSTAPTSTTMPSAGSPDLIRARPQRRYLGRNA